MDGRRTHEKLQALLARSQRLESSTATESAPLPALERDAAQLASAAANLRRSAGPAASQRADAVLGGQRLEKLERELHQIAPSKLPLDPQNQHAYHEQVVLSTVEEAVVATRTETEHQLYRLLEDDWELAKRELLEDLEHEERGDWRPVSRSDARSRLRDAVPTTTNPLLQLALNGERSGTSVESGDFDPMTAHTPFSAAAQTAARSGSALPADARVRAYARVVEDSLGAGEWRGAEGVDLVERFASAAASVDDREAVDMLPTWELVRCIVEKGAAAGARQFLEARYLDFVRGRLALNGVAPSPRSSVSADVRSWLALVARSPLSGSGTLSEQLGRWQQHQEWAVVYFTLRCGAWGEAARLIEDGVQQHRINVGRAVDCARLLRLARAAHEPTSSCRELDGERSALRAEFDAFDAEKHSPWQRQLYQLLSCHHERSPDSAVVSNIQDWMWLKLCFALLPHEPTYTVRALAISVLRFGPRHFQAEAQPYLYARLLLMCGEAARAVAFLAARGGAHFIDAVHLAVAMRACDALCTASPEITAAAAEAQAVDVALGVSAGIPADGTGRAPLPHLVLGDTTPQQAGSLSMGSLLRVFVERYLLSAHELRLAVRYVVQLRGDPPDRAPTTEALALLRELLLQSREYAVLLDGTSSSYSENGASAAAALVLQRHDGVFYELLRPPKLVQTLVHEAAQRAEAQGLTLDAMQLYLRCGARGGTRAVELLSEQLAAAIDPSRPARAADYDYLRALAHSISSACAHNEVGLAVGGAQLTALHQLLSLTRFYELIREGANDPVRCAEALEHVGFLFPATRSEVSMRVESFGELQPCVIDAIHGAVQATMNAVECLFQIYRTDPIRSAQLQERASALVTFLGLLKTRLHIRSDVAAQIARHELTLL